MVGGMHHNTDEPPMFARASGGTPYRKKSQQSSVAQIVTEAATAFTSALSPKSTTSIYWSREQSSKDDREQIKATL